MSNSKVYIGPAGWSYPDWRGIVYPHKRPRDFSELAFISQYFNTVEVNSSFYKIPTAATAERWVKYVHSRKDFRFCVKLWQTFTHSDAAVESSELRKFKQALNIIAAAGRLGPLLIQFPWRFKKTQASIDRVLRLVDIFAEFDTAVEFRHRSWLDAEILECLREQNVSFVNIDQPVIGESLPPSQVVTTKNVYVRFHGRNEDAWFAEGAGRDARYNYLYTSDEIQSWKAPIEDMMTEADVVYIIFNNHFRGKAIINAFDLMFQMTHEKKRAPENLLRHYPAAAQFLKPDFSGQTMELF